MTIWEMYSTWPGIIWLFDIFTWYLWNLNFIFEYRTKVMCREGGCGACLATAEIFDYTTGQNVSCSINTVF